VDTSSVLTDPAGLREGLEAKPPGVRLQPMRSRGAPIRALKGTDTRVRQYLPLNHKSAEGGTKDDDYSDSL
jgi:hypothetical protein